MLVNIKSVLKDILQTNKEKIKIQTARLPRHNANTTTTKEREKETKTKEMPKPNIPYSPNDYWDRRFSSDSDKSPSHSIAALPHHPPALSITSTSPSRNNEIPPPSSRGRSSQRTYAQELQLRSRSPKLFQLRPQDKADTTENGDGGRDPATRLGGFRAVNPRTSRVGDQELPWKLSLPGDTSPGTSDAAAAAAAAADADTGDGSDQHPQRGQIRTINEGQPPVELPSHKDKDDEGEEIVMSSTAYPGQEWRPDGLSQWEYW